MFDFDNQEYSQIISIKLTADTYIKKCPNISDENINLIKNQIQYFEHYSKYRKRSQVYESSVILIDMADGLNNNMSKYYCEEKFNNISKAAERIAETLGKL